jgi:hypothetical protein
VGTPPLASWSPGKVGQNPALAFTVGISTTFLMHTRDTGRLVERLITAPLLDEEAVLAGLDRRVFGRAVHLAAVEAIGLRGLPFLSAGS